MPPFQGLYPLERLLSIILSSRRDLEPDKVKSCDSIRERCREKIRFRIGVCHPFRVCTPLKRLFSIIISSRRDLEPDKVKSCEIMISNGHQSRRDDSCNTIKPNANYNPEGWKYYSTIKTKR